METTSNFERGTTTIEFVGLAAAAVVLLGGVAIGMNGDAAALGGSVVGAVRGAVAGEPARPHRPRQAGNVPLYGRRSVSTAHEERWKSSDDAPRVPRSDLRMSPVLPGDAVWQATRTDDVAGPAGLSASSTVRVCAVCVDAAWRDGLRAGVSAQGSLHPSGGDLINADVSAEARVGLVGVDLLGVVQERAGWGDWKIQGRARGTVGADASGRLIARVGADGVELGASGSAMVGAVARGEARAGVDLLGVAVTTRARAEGWAGAGVRGTASVTRSGTKVTWDAGAGAALGLGGSLEWGGSVDISKLRPGAQDVARSTLGIAASFLLPGVSGLFLPITKHGSH